MKTLASLPALAAALALSATTLHAQPVPSGSAAVPDSTAPTWRLGTPARVEVTNANWRDIHLYLDRDGELMPVGVVTPGEDTEITLPLLATTAGDVRLVAAPIGGSDVYVSPILFLQPGDVVDLSLEQALNFSFASILPRR